MHGDIFKMIGGTNTSTTDGTQKQITYEELLKDPRIKNKTNPWVGTIWEEFYTYNPSRKGSAGEIMIPSYLFKTFGISESRRTDAGHDRELSSVLPVLASEVNGKAISWRTEIKISLAARAKKNKFMFNHISLSKNFDRMIFLGVNIGDIGPADSNFYWMTRRDVETAIELKLFKRQQSGQNGGNDDYIFACSTKKLAKMHAHKLFRTFDTWNDPNI